MDMRLALDEDRTRRNFARSRRRLPGFLLGTTMHYRNGREAKNGDKIVKLEGGKIVAFGVLHSATPGNDYCNGNIATIQPPNDYACMVDCLHVDDVAGLLTQAELDRRPAGK